MTTFLLVRHASTEWIGKALAGRLDGVHLDDAGRAQAKRLADRFHGTPPNALYSSPLERALETVQPLAARAGVTVQTRPRLTEVDFGDWTGARLADLDAASDWRRFNAFRSSTRVPHGELMLEIAARIVSEMEDLRLAHQGETVMLVSHGDVIKAAVAHYAGTPLDLFHRFEISPASVSTIELGEHGVRILGVNDTSALRD